MDSAHCPGCGAAVRPKEEWCSLCYQDLRPQEPLVIAGEVSSPVTTTTGAQPSAQPVIAPVISIAGIPRPSSPLDAELLDVAESLGVDAELLAHDDSHKAWPCSCGTEVAFDVASCPACGRAFLGDLRGLDAPDRTGPSWLTAYLEGSRTKRLAIAAFVAFVVAVAIPGVLVLFG